MSTRDLFGRKSNDLDAARVLVERALSLTLEPRYGSYHGGEYFSKQLDCQDKIILQINNDNDGEPGAWADEDYQDFGILLSIESMTNGDLYQQALACQSSGFVLLERSLITPTGLLRRTRYNDGNVEVVFERPFESGNGIAVSGAHFTEQRDVGS
ncbi:MAG: hypothetical protein ABI353_01395 [Isosphaeraceae bacterium]